MGGLSLITLWGVSFNDRETWRFMVVGKWVDTAVVKVFDVKSNS